MEIKMKATEEQLAYAKLLDVGMKIGLLMLLITFALYVSGIMTPHIPTKLVPKIWNQRVGNYLYILSQADKGGIDEAMALVNSCKAAPEHGPQPEECKAITEEGHKYTGWTWLGRLGKADFLNFIGVVFLAGVTIVCYGRIIPILFRKKDTVYGVIAALEVAVLVLAASGLLRTGGH
jgi:hypothetical protein